MRDTAAAAAAAAEDVLMTLMTMTMTRVCTHAAGVIQRCRRVARVVFYHQKTHTHTRLGARFTRARLIATTPMHSLRTVLEPFTEL